MSSKRVAVKKTGPIVAGLVFFAALILATGLGGFGPVVNAEEFDRVQKGMTYEQVVEIIGAQAEQLGSSELGGVNTVEFRWRNGGWLTRFFWPESGMRATFQENELLVKSQYNLR